MARRRIFGPKLRKLIPCGYCFEEWADCYDHINPVCNGGTNRKSNLYPACARCNSLASGLVFKSLDEKRDYLKAKLREREEWHSAEEMRKMREALSANKTTVAEVLFRSVPIGKVERAKREQKKKFGKLCVCCGDRSAKVICGSVCKEILWFNRLLEEFLEVRNVNIELRNKLEKLAGLPITTSQDSGFRPPQARIPFVVRSVKPTRSGKGKAVELETGKWLYCFDNRKMGEDGETLFNILEETPGKLCVFTTKVSKKTTGQEYANITGILQCGEREWDESGIPVLRREPATKPTREPGDDTEEQWLK